MAAKKEQYALIAFLYHDNNIVKMMTERDLQFNTLKSGKRGRAIVEQRGGARAVIYGVQYERMERRPTKEKDGCVYVVRPKSSQSV